MTTIRCTFAVLSSDLNPARMTEILGCVPDNAVIVGRERSPPRMTPKFHGWYVDHERRDYKDVGVALAELLNRVSPMLQKLPALRKMDANLEVKFLVAVTPMASDVSLFFDAHVLRSVVNLGASLDIEFFDEETENTVT